MEKTLTTLVVIGLAAAGHPGGALAAEGDAERGRYLAAIMDCQGCHSGRMPNGELAPGQHLTGGTIGFELPGWGTFWPPNLTPHETGLAEWTAEDIIRAVRTGERPDGRLLAPIMPWPSYAELTDEDARDLAAYLQSLAPADNKVPAPLGQGEPAAAPYFAVIVPGAQKPD